MFHAAEALILVTPIWEARHETDATMRIAIVNLVMRTVTSNHFLPQLDRSLPTKDVRADSPMAVLLGDELARMGHEVDVFVGSMFDVVREAEQAMERRASLTYVKEAVRWIFPPSYYPLAPSVATQLRKKRYDAILASELIQPSTLLALAMAKGGTRTFVWQELGSHPRFPASLLSKFAFSLLRIGKFSRIEKIVPRSESAKQFLISEGVPKGKISRVIPNCVDCRIFTPHYSSDYFEKIGLGLPPRPRTIMIARIDRKKGIETYLDSIKIAVNKGYAGSFVLKASGHGFENLPRLVRNLGLGDRVTIIGGYLPRRDLANLMASCDICAAPSSGDLLFFVPLEAMASGLAVITTAVTHHAATFSDGKAGVLVPHDDPAALAEAIVELGRDLTRLKRMGADARELAVREFSTESVARRFVEEMRGPIA
jgi:glycosyltransferase involved in cell wall biosynthesis